MGRTIAGGLGSLRSGSARSPIAFGAAAFAVALAPCAGSAASASSLPLAAGPVLTLVPAGKSVVLEGASATGSGEALVSLSIQPDCCRADRPLLVRQRRGPRGPFGAAVQVADATAQAGRTSGSTPTILAANGDAYLAYVRAGVGIEVLVRRGWTGRWVQRPVPDGAGAYVYVDPVMTLSADGRTLDLLWLDPTPPVGASAGFTVRSARLEGSAWQPLCPPARCPTSPAASRRG